MTRRNGAGAKIVAVAAVVLILIYGIYIYSDVVSKLKTSEDKTERLRQQYDSLSAQLQVVYEHKSRLEKSLQQEKSDHKKTRDDLVAKKADAETKYLSQKQELINRVNTINQEYKMLQSQHEDLQGEFTKLQEQQNKLLEDHKQQLEQHGLEFRQMKQDKENDIAKLQDDIANLKRRYTDVMSKLQGSQQKNQQQAQWQLQQQQQLNQQQQQQLTQQQNQFKQQLEQNQLKQQQQNQLMQQQGQNQFIQQQPALGQQPTQSQQNLGGQQNLDTNNQQYWLDKNQLNQPNFNQNQNALGQNNQNQFNQNQNIGQNNQNAFNQNQNAFNQNQNLLHQNDNSFNQNQNAIDADQNIRFNPQDGNVVDNSINNNLNNIGQNQGGQNQFDQQQQGNNMQIAIPGQDKHPGYHEVKDVDPNDKLHHEKEMARNSNNNEADAENKGPVVMQQAPPNLNDKIGGDQDPVHRADDQNLVMQAPQPGLEDNFRKDGIRNHPEILGQGGLGGMGQPNPKDSIIEAPVAADNNQIPIPVRGAGVENEDADEADDEDKYDDNGNDGHLNPQGQVMPPNLQHNPRAKVRDSHNLLDHGQPVADNGDYGNNKPEADDNDGDYQEDEDEDNRGHMGAGRDFA